MHLSHEYEIDAVNHAKILESNILIVDDDRIIRMAVNAMFESEGYTHLREAKNGLEALDVVKEWRPDLIIMDVLMPGMTGLDCCVRIRQMPEMNDVPILVQTALSDFSDKKNMFSAGASDFLTKPIEPREVVTRARIHLERNLAIEEMKNFNGRLRHELATARETHQLIMPNDAVIQDVEENYQLDIQHFMQTSSELGGDFWGMVPLSESELAIYLVDFAGHGINAALQTFRINSLIQNSHRYRDKPAAYLKQLNEVLCGVLTTGQYATMFYGVIDVQHNRMEYASAACPQMLLLRDNNYEALEAKGFMLGVKGDATYESHRIEFGSSDSLLLYSDALIETEGEDGRCLTEEQVAKQLQSSSFNKLLEGFKKSYMPRIRDDVTLVMCSRKGK